MLVATTKSQLVRHDGRPEVSCNDDDLLRFRKRRMGKNQLGG